MLVYTPRWGTKLAVYEASVGSLPNAASGTGQRHAIPGPPAGSKMNITSGFGERGSRPMILNFPGDDLSNGDYVFILFTTLPSGGTRARVVRTRQIRQISNQDDWLTATSDPSARVFQQGPDLPDPTLQLLQASGGHAAPTFYVGGNGRSELWKWTAGMASWTKIVPGNGASSAVRFFANPYDSNVIYILDTDHIKRSDNAGTSWQIDANLEKQLTSNGRIPPRARRKATSATTSKSCSRICNSIRITPLFDSRSVKPARSIRTTERIGGGSWTRARCPGVR